MTKVNWLGYLDAGVLEQRDLPFDEPDEGEGVLLVIVIEAKKRLVEPGHAVNSKTHALELGDVAVHDERLEIAE